MPRIVKILPLNPEDYSFGDLVYWHLFKYGTQPDVPPSAKMGRVWKLEKVTAKLDITDRTLRNWINDRHLPDDIIDLANLLFGNNAAHDAARAWLQEKLDQARARRVSRSTARARPLLPAISGEEAHFVSDDEPVEPDQGDGRSLTEIVPTRYLEDAILRIGQGRNERRANPGGGYGPVGPFDPILFFFKRARAAKRRPVSVTVIGLSLLLGLYTWSRPSTPETEVARTETKLPEVPETRPRPATPGVPTKTNDPSPPPAAPPPVTRVPAPLTDQAVVEKTIEALKKQQEADKLARERESLERDRAQTAATKVAADRETYLRHIAGMGFSLKENQSIQVGISLGPTVTATVQECALSCLSEGCDGFAYYRAQSIGPASQGRSCYRYKKPLSFFVHGDYTSGERTTDLLSQSTTDQIPAPTQVKSDPVQIAQAIAPTASPPPDGITRCSTGPFKVTGFNLLCDKLATGGTTLGSVQLSYTVNDINDCAAKCRPIQRCTGFAFNSNEPAGRRSCMIFGGTTEFNNGGGWISGTR